MVCFVPTVAFFDGEGCRCAAAPYFSFDCSGALRTGMIEVGCSMVVRFLAGEVGTGNTSKSAQAVESAAGGRIPRWAFFQIFGSDDFE